MNISEKAEWLRLSGAESVGPVTFKHLLAKFKTPKAALEALPEFSKRLGRARPLNIQTQEFALAYLEKCRKQNVEVIASCQADYPKNLLHIVDNPPILHVRGRKELLNKESIAVVGSRNASLQGLAFTGKITKDLSNSGLVIVSGLARGIDAAAHKMSLELGTIAVNACGVDVIYPQENKELYEKIAQQGVIVSEALLSKEPRPQAFTYRNRLISGISSGVLIIEAAMKSGTLITAQYAAAQGKDVFAVPGHPYDPRAHGTNYLIKNGAFLVESAANIIEHRQNIHYKINTLFDDVVNEINEDSVQDFIYEEEEIKKFLLDKLSAAPITINEIAQVSPYLVSHLQSALAELEIAGIVEVDRNIVRKLEV